MYKDAGDEHDAPHHELDHTPHDLFVEMAELIGKIKKHAFKKYEQFAAKILACFWGSSTRSNLNLIMKFDEIFLSEVNDDLL